MPKIPPPPTSNRQSPPMMEDMEVETPQKRGRTPKMKKLEESVAGVYVLVGGLGATLPGQMGSPRFRQAGLALTTNANEIAEAWIDLAEDDAKVRKVLESLTSVSGWGKVVGVHLVAIGSSLPGVAPIMNQQSQPSNNEGTSMPVDDPLMAMAIAEALRMQRSQERAERQPPPQAPPMQTPEQTQEQAPRVRRQEQTKPGRGVGMPTASDLGVTNADMPVDFPTGGAENIRG